MKKLSKLLMSFLIIIAMFFAFNADASVLNPGEIAANKSANVVTGGDGRSVDITIGVAGEAFTYVRNQKREIVLVLDASGSMNEEISAGKTKLAALKEATNSLLDTLLPDGVTNNTKVGIVYYNRSAKSIALTNNKTELKSFVNGINADGGTNVQYGLKLANGLFTSEESEKSLILLSDGEPTFYTTDESKIVGSGSDDSTACEDSFLFWCTDVGIKPSEAATAEAGKSPATIYSIGFGVADDSEAAKFLIGVSGENRYYGTSSLAGLKTTFTEITERVDIVAKNVSIVDNVPSTFDIDEEYFVANFGEKATVNDNTVKYGSSVTVRTNSDGSKTVTKYFGDLKAGDNCNFTFRVKAKDNYYGNMFTNGEAKVIGIATDNNPFYVETKDVEIELAKPTVVIPAVTKDDKYLVNQGETLNGNVRDNDYKAIQKDNNANVVDEVLVVTNVSNGSLKLNKDGSFNYTAPKDFSGDVTFTYYIKTIVEVDGKRFEVNSNTSTVTITVNKVPTNYVVHYYLENTTESVANDFNGNGNVYEKVNAKALDLDNYEVVGKSEASIVLGKENNTIIFYYRLKQGGKVTVHYYINGTLDKVADDKVLDGKVTEDYITSGIGIENWILVGNSGNVSGKFTLEEQEVIYYYEMEMGTVVVKYVDKDGESLADDTILKGQTSTGYKAEALEIEGYKLVEVKGSEEGKFTSNGGVVTYVYELIPEEIEEIGQEATTPIINTGVTSSNSSLIVLILSALLTTGLVVFRKKINL